MTAIYRENKILGIKGHKNKMCISFSFRLYMRKKSSTQISKGKYFTSSKVVNLIVVSICVNISYALAWYCSYHNRNSDNENWELHKYLTCGGKEN